MTASPTPHANALWGLCSDGGVVILRLVQQVWTEMHQVRTGGPGWGQASGLDKQGSETDHRPLSPSSPEAVAALASLQLPAGRTMSPREVEGLMEQTVRQVQETLNLEPDVAQHLLAHAHWGAEQLLQSYSDDPEPLLLAAGLRVPQAQAAPTRPDHCPVCVSPLAPDHDLPALCCQHSCCKVRLSSPQHHSSGAPGLQPRKATSGPG